MLVVCFGNLCRSPMAEGLLRARLPEDQWKVASAGTHAIGGDRPTEFAAMSVKELEGIDISGQCSTPLTVDELKRSDYVFTMSRMQAAEAVALLPEVASRTRLLGAFSPATEEQALPSEPLGGVADREEIGDPMGADLEAYRRCYQRLAEATDAAAAWLCAGAPKREGPPAADAWLRPAGETARS